MRNHIWASSEKVPNRLSHCHRKRRMEAATDFKKKIQKNLKSQCHTKRRMGMAMCTHPPLVWQRIRTLGTFSQRSPSVHVHTFLHAYWRVNWELFFPYAGAPIYLFANHHLLFSAPHLVNHVDQMTVIYNSNTEYGINRQDVLKEL